MLLLYGACIEPYEPNLKKYEDLLVVDALITNEEIDHTIKLSRTFQSEDNVVQDVTDAIVNVSDDLGNSYHFSEVSSGKYQISARQFVAETGRKYQLYIKTIEGKEYLSDTCEIIPVPEIENISYGFDTDFIENDTIEVGGMRFYVDAEDSNGECKYYRWHIDEAWKFKIPYPVTIEVLEGDEISQLPRVENVYCWKFDESKNIIIHSTQNYATTKVTKFPIHFASPELSDRFNLRYSILVKQYSLSEKEYLFWKNLQISTELTGDIFQRQPFTLSGNIYNISDDTEPVLGYFQVSAVTTKRAYVTPYEMRNAGFRNFKNEFENCTTIDTARTDFYMLNAAFAIFGYVAFEPLYSEFSAEPVGLRFTRKRCSDCSRTGDPRKPDFWED